MVVVPGLKLILKLINGATGKSKGFFEGQSPK